MAKELGNSSPVGAGDENLIVGLGTKGRYISDINKLAEVVSALKTIGAKIVLTQGTFDFIHIGHFVYLEKARAMGNILIVGVDSDAKVQKRKGPDRPIVKEQERLQMLTHVRHVDLVTLKTPDMSKWQLIKTLRPDVLVATQETYNPQQIKDLKKYCGNVVVLAPQATTSTTAKLRRLNIGLSNKIRDAVNQSINDTFEKLVQDA